tara:strand:+ start:29860 stop:31860 length:2001 start_codon:yes stop_codon:yes gene_type:complete
VLYCCSYSNPALAYTQQYNVGDTGPNGGTVQSVTVTSTVTGTEVALNGGFEETTTTTQYTETVIEQISTTQTVTNSTTTSVETTTTNTLPGIEATDWTATGTAGGVNSNSCSYSGGIAAGEACMGKMNNVNNNLVTTNNYNVNTLGGGQVTSEYVELGTNLTESEIQAGFTLNYGVRVQSHASNATVPLCSATSGDCKDVFRITTRLYKADPNGGNLSNILIGTYNQYETLTFSNFRNYSYTEDIGSNNYTEIWGQMELWGVDAGYHKNVYGPIFSAPFMTLTYDVLTTVTETITQLILSTQETVYNTSEESVTSVFIGDPTTDTTIPEIDFEVVDSFEIEIVNEDTGGGIEMEFTVEVDETSNTANVEMSSTNLDTGVVQVETIAEISLDFEMDTGATEMPEITVAEIEADIGSQIDSAVGDAISEIEVDVGPTETMEVASVNTSEGNSNEPSTQETVSEGESTESTNASEQATESVQESSPDAEQPVEDSGTEPEGSDSGDSEAGEDTSGSETESEASDSGESGTDSEGDESSSRGEKSEGKDGDSKSSKDKSKQENKSDAEKKKEYVEKKVAEAKQKIATRILSAMADTYSAINETTKIALISSLTDTKNFQAYLDKQNALPLDWYTDTQIYTEMPMLLDPAGILYDMAQDKIMDEMIMMQYE